MTYFDAGLMWLGLGLWAAYMGWRAKFPTGQCALLLLVGPIVIIAFTILAISDLLKWIDKKRGII